MRTVQEWYEDKLAERRATPVFDSVPTNEALEIMYDNAAPPRCVWCGENGDGYQHNIEGPRMSPFSHTNGALCKECSKLNAYLQLEPEEELDGIPA